jgi:hypothetical protein
MYNVTWIYISCNMYIMDVWAYFKLPGHFWDLIYSSLLILSFINLNILCRVLALCWFRLGMCEFFFWCLLCGFLTCVALTPVLGVFLLGLFRLPQENPIAWVTATIDTDPSVLEGGHPSQGTSTHCTGGPLALSSRGGEREHLCHSQIIPNAITLGSRIFVGILERGITIVHTPAPILISPSFKSLPWAGSHPVCVLHPWGLSASWTSLMPCGPLLPLTFPVPVTLALRFPVT